MDALVLEHGNLGLESSPDNMHMILYPTCRFPAWLHVWLTMPGIALKRALRSLDLAYGSQGVFEVKADAVDHNLDLVLDENKCIGRDTAQGIKDAGLQEFDSVVQAEMLVLAQGTRDFSVEFVVLGRRLRRSHSCRS